MKRLPSILLGLSATLLSVSALPAQSLSPAARDSKAMRTVATLLEEGHLTEQRLNDTISERALVSYLDALDPLKYYFEAGDLREFDEVRDKLDDMMRRGDASFAHRVFQRYLKRVDERVEAIEKLLDEPMDFTVDEWLVTDPDKRSYPADAEKARDRWRKRTKYELLELRDDGMSDEDARKRLRRRYQGFKRRAHRIEPDEMVETFITSIARSFDPHSSYMGAHTLENFEIRMRLDYHGVGALLVEEDGDIVVERILPGGPAEKQGGLAAGDNIITVGQDKEGPLKDVAGMRLRDVVQLIRGKAGTVVRLEVINKGGGDPTVHSFVRGRTELVDRTAQAEVRTYEDGDKKLKVGVIDLPSFYGNRGGSGRGATRDVARLLGDFADQNVDVAVLDLRGNGGGYLSEAVDLAGLFIDKGPVVQVKGFTGRVDVLEDEEAGVAWDGPLVVLTSKISASASEIVAGAIKDYGRGLIVGDESSHGKGTVQRVMALDPPDKNQRLGALKLTIQKFYRVTGNSTQLRGVLADVALPSFSNVAGIGEDEIDNALPFDEIDAVNYTSYGQLKPHMVAQLRERSRERRDAAEKFVELERRVAAYTELREQSRVPLQEEKFLAMRKEFARNEPDEPTDELGVEEKKPTADDPYLTEVIGIAADYARLLKGADLAEDPPKTPRRKSGG